MQNYTKQMNKERKNSFFCKIIMTLLHNPAEKLDLQPAQKMPLQKIILTV